METAEQYQILKIRNGDKTAFEQLFRQYYPVLCSYANQILHDPDEAEEIVQEFFVQFWQKREELDVRTALKSYLFRSVHNRCLNLIKHHKIKETYIQNVQHENSEPFTDSPDTGDTKTLEKAIQHAIESLPPERKKVFLMVRYEERRYKEVAEILGISVKTVENQMGKAMQFLRKALNEYLSLFIAILLNFIFNSNR